jgi:hypothetical protein
MNWPTRSFTLVVTVSLVLATVQAGCANGVAQPIAAPLDQTVVESPDELDQLVAPIALYPDNLVAQILAASTWPSEVVEADRWMQQESSLKGTELAQAVNQQVWDPSVKALTQFPLVLTSMDMNLSWSSALGNTYASEPQNVLNAIQVMRRRAQQAGHLIGTPQEVVTNGGNTIIIQPADAETVYLPEYDPWLVYGAPITVYPDWYGIPGLFVTDPDVLFGLSVGIGTFAGFGWGWHHWGADWHGRGVVYDQSPYRSRGQHFANYPDFRGAHMAFAPAGGFHGGLWHGATGADNRGFSGLNRVGIAGSLGARGGPGFGGGFHVAAGGFHGGGFAGGGHR